MLCRCIVKIMRDWFICYIINVITHTFIIYILDILMNYNRHKKAVIFILLCLIICEL